MSRMAGAGRDKPAGKPVSVQARLSPASPRAGRGLSRDGRQEKGRRRDRRWIYRPCKLLVCAGTLINCKSWVKLQAAPVPSRRGSLLPGLLQPGGPRDGAGSGQGPPHGSIRAHFAVDCSSLVPQNSPPFFVAKDFQAFCKNCLGGERWPRVRSPGPPFGAGLCGTAT